MQPDTYQIVIPILLLPFLSLLLWRIGIWRLKRYHSPLLGTVEIFKKYNGEKLLTINSYAQGVSTENRSIKKSYWFCIAEFITKFCHNKKNPQVLMLGLGANTITNLIAQINPHIHQTIVEIDQSIIQACRDYFGLDQLPNYQIILADAYKLVDDIKLFEKKFDVVIVDIFTGKPPYVSLESNQPNFIQKLLSWLKDDGMIVFNRPAHTKVAQEESKQLQKYLSALFHKTGIIFIDDPRGYKTEEVFGQKKRR